jgi:hypothetical protein
MPELFVPDAADRETLWAFVARAVRLDGQTAVRLRQRGDGVVEAWTATPFECLATRAVAGDVTPGDVTVSGNELLAALTVAGAPRMDPGPARDLLCTASCRRRAVGRWWTSSRRGWCPSWPTAG